MTRARFQTLVICFAPVLFAAEADCQPTPLPPTAASTFTVKAFGAVGDGTHLDTPAITAAIQAAAAAGGGVVVFTPGTYRTGTFELLSNVSLDLEAGSILQGSKDLSDYLLLKNLGFGHVYGVDSSGEGDRAGMIVARRAASVAIFGQGIIDGSGDEFFDFHTPHVSPDFDARYTRDARAFTEAVQALDDGPVQMKPAGRPGTMIILSHSSNILIRDVTLRNAPNWTLHLASSEHAVVTGLRIANNPLLPNNDGVDCIGCRDVHFSDCDISAGDDDFAIIGSDNVTVVNCTLASNSSGIRLEDTRFATFSNLTIHANRGIGVFERGGGTTAGILFSNLVIQTRLLTGHWWGKGEPVYMATAGASKGVHDVHFSNIVADSENGMVLYGSPANLIRDVSFERVRLRIHAPRDAARRGVGGNFDLRWTATDLTTAVFQHDIPGLYCRWAAGLKLRGLEMEWDANLPGYFSNGVECEDFKNLEIDGFSGRQAAAGSNGAVILLRRGDGVSIRNSTATQGAATFVSASEVTGQGLFIGNDLENARQAFEPVKSEFTLFGNLLPQ
jgi:parallel beta-helix repeat protein